MESSNSSREKHHQNPPPPPPPQNNSYNITTSPNNNNPNNFPNYPNFSSSANNHFSALDHPSSFSDPARKKRGRPRKYSPDNNIALRLSNKPSSEARGDILPVSGSGVGMESGSGGKKGRGRPPGSGKRQLDALGGQAGIGFTPHVILVNPGEDITSKIKAFSQQGPRTICILSANGATSNACICTSTLSGSSVTYEGRYEIISLEGSFSLSESNSARGRTGGMSVTLAGPDGRVFGGSVSGMLIAASPVQVIVGSFIEDGKKPKYVPSSSSPPVPNMLNFGPPVDTSSPPSQQPSSPSSDEDGDGSPYDGVSVPYTNDDQHQPMHNMPMYSGWGSSNINMHPH